MKERRFLFAVAFSLLGIISFVNYSGYAFLINSNDKTAYVLILIGAGFLISNLKRISIIKKSDVLFWFFSISLFWGRAALVGQEMDGMRFLTYFICIFIVSKFTFSETNLGLMGVIYGGMVGILLFLCNFKTIFNGWNTNALGIEILQMLMLFFIGYNTDYEAIKRERNETIANFRMAILFAISIFAMYFMSILKCRSASFTAFFTVILMLKNNLGIKALRDKKVLLRMILIPLFVAVFAVVVVKMPHFTAIDEISREYIGKPIFNGRDEIWQTGLDEFFKKPFLGDGFLNSGNRHNSAVAILIGYGVLGYGFCIAVFHSILSKATAYMEDVFVRKSVIAFILVVIQQSFENTMFNSRCLILFPYMILGIILGRINYLKKETADKVIGEREDV